MRQGLTNGMGPRFGAGAALLLAACAGTPGAIDAAPTPANLTANEFPGAASVLTGFSPCDDGEWRAGDAVLFGLRLRRDGELRRWLLRLEVVQPTCDEEPRVWDIEVNGTPERFESALCRLRATVCDGDGIVLGESVVSAPRDFLANGFASVCASIVAGKPTTAREMAFGVVSAMALLETVRQDPALSPVFWAVVEKPSVWSLLGNLGVSLLVRPDFESVAVRAAPDAAMPVATAFGVPVELQVNERPALLAELIVGAPHAPLGVGAGVLAAKARHPSVPGLEVELRLLAARRAARR